MTVEKYVKQITRKIQCTGKRRMEIQKQLLSDIESAIENGETPENVMERMGTAENVAEEFNQNLSYEEKMRYKKARRRKIWMAVVLAAVLLGLLIYWFVPKTVQMGESGFFNEQEVSEMTNKVIDALDDENYEELKEYFSEELKEVLGVADLEEAKASISKNWGSRISIGSIYMQEMRRSRIYMAIVQVSVAYENVTVIYTFSYNEDMELVGLYMR